LVRFVVIVVVVTVGLLYVDIYLVITFDL